MSWNDMHQAQAIEFDGSAMRTFKAVFFDNMGKQASQQTVITFTCAGGCAVDGTCPDTQNDSNNCGTCGNVCELSDIVGNDFGQCVEGACTPTFGECVVATDPPVPCSQVCADQGYPGCATCSSLGGWALVWYFSPSDCEQDSGPNPGGTSCGTEPDTMVEAAYRCCCLPKN